MSDNQGTAELGRRLVIEALQHRGAVVNGIRHGNMVLLEVQNPSSGRRARLRVKTRRSGTWQGSTRDADPNPTATSPETFSVFVDLAAPRATFHIVPDAWMRRDIHAAHQAYVARHGGRRAVTQGSEHHAIQPQRVRQWRDRWDLLGL